MCVLEAKYLVNKPEVTAPSALHATALTLRICLIQQFVRNQPRPINCPHPHRDRQSGPVLSAFIVSSEDWGYPTNIHGGWEKQNNPTFSHSQRQLCDCPAVKGSLRDWVEERSVLYEFRSLQSLCASALMVLHYLSVSLSLSGSPWCQEEREEWRKGERQRERARERKSEKGRGCWWLKAAPWSIHMQMVQRSFH